MITAEVAITPIGTSSTSISEYVAQSERVLKENDGKFNYKITGMSTQIECENIDDLLNLVKKMHNAQFEKGVKRVSTMIRIDDRKDKKSCLDYKVESVMSKI